MAQPRRRRPKGTGGVTFRKSSQRFVARANGIERTARTEREAWALHALILSGQIARRPKPAAPAPSADLTVAAFLARWLTHLEARNVAPGTRRHHAHVAARMGERLGHVKLAQLTPALVQEAVDDLSRAGYASNTVRATRHAFSTALAWAEDLEIVRRNPVRRTRAPKAHKRRDPRLTLEKARAVREAYAGTRIAGMVTLALLFGLREGELCGIRWQDVEGDTITIRGQVNDAREYVPRTKTDRDRALPVLPLVDAVLQAERVRQATERLRYGAAYESRGFVFQSADGRPLSPAAVRYQWGRRRPEPGLTFHDLRHGANSRLRQMGVSDSIREAVFGHSAAQNRQTYGHYSVEELSAALGPWAAALSG